MKKHLISLLILFLLLLTSFVGVSNQKTNVDTNKSETRTDGGLMNSSWPMYCHDTHHTGRSPYSTAENPPGVIKWSFMTDKYSLFGSPAIDNYGIIYLGAGDLYALYPNGTKKWQCILNGQCESCPAIDENGIIYVGTTLGDPNYLYAIYPDGTTKWRYWTGGMMEILSSPAIGSDGTIYFGCGGGSPPSRLDYCIIPQWNTEMEL